MHNAFNYLAVYTVTGTTSEALGEALSAGAWIRAGVRTEHVVAVMFGAADEESALDYVPGTTLTPHLLECVRAAAEEEDEFSLAAAYEHLYALDLDSSLANARMAQLRQFTGVDVWHTVHVIGTETSADDTLDPAHVHGGWLAYASTPTGCLVANMITDPFLFEADGALHTTRPTDAHAYLIAGSDTLVAVFLQTLGARDAVTERTHTVIGYHSRNSYRTPALLRTLYNCSYLQNASMYRMGVTTHGHGVTVQRAYRYLRNEWKHLTYSSPDLYIAAPYGVGMVVPFNFVSWSAALQEAHTELMGDDAADDADEFAFTVDTCLGSLEEEFGDTNFIALTASLDPEALRGCPIHEAPTTDTPDAGQLVLSAIAQPLFGCSLHTLDTVHTHTVRSAPRAAFMGAVPNWYSDERFNHVIPHAATRFAVPLELDGAPDAVLTIDPHVLPPYIALRVLPTLLTLTDAQTDEELALADVYG